MKKSTTTKITNEPTIQ